MFSSEAVAIHSKGKVKREIFCSSDSKTVVPRPVAFALCSSLLETRSCGPYPRPPESGILGVRSSNRCFRRAPGDSDICEG